MIKLIAFDLDDTLANIGEPIPAKIVTLMKKIEKRKIKIAICSGKPTFYLAGIMRQVGLESPILVGENGANIQLGIELPPQNEFFLPVEKVDLDLIGSIRIKVLKEFGTSVWLQPNRVVLTCFFANSEVKDQLGLFLKDELKRVKNELYLFEHSDSFDLCPKINKGDGLNFLYRILKISQLEVIAVGDGSNDYPMFEVSNHSIGINLKAKNMARDNVSSIRDAFALIDQYLSLN